ncbi:hypothetical protein HYPSUDRAFT_60193, partial [Hypholoma sublateritium FD-334 SS-4]
LVLYYFRDHSRTVVSFGSPPEHSMTRSARSSISTTASEASREQRWQVVFTGRKPGVFQRSKYEWLDRDVLDYYDTFERAKAVFSRAVEEGRVTRLQKIVTRERVSLGDNYFGSTTDQEVLDCTKQWHVVTVGRDPGIFSSDTAKLAVKGFAEAVGAGMNAVSRFGISGAIGSPDRTYIRNVVGSTNERDLRHEVMLRVERGRPPRSGAQGPAEERAVEKRSGDLVCGVPRIGKKGISMNFGAHGVATKAHLRGSKMRSALVRARVVWQRKCICEVVRCGARSAQAAHVAGCTRARTEHVSRGEQSCIEVGRLGCVHSITPAWRGDMRLHTTKGGVNGAPPLLRNPWVLESKHEVMVWTVFDTKYKKMPVKDVNG